VLHIQNRRLAPYAVEDGLLQVKTASSKLVAEKLLNN
jgi:hypothetical protein